MAVTMDARGLSTRDIEALFADETGTSLLSRSAVSQIGERLWAKYEGFARCDLSVFDVAALFVEGIAERLHLGQPREAVLARLQRDASCRPAAGICSRRSCACQTTSKPASRSGAVRLAIAGPCIPPTCASACSARRGGALRCSPTSLGSRPS
jgi:hypothetical protein